MPNAVMIAGLYPKSCPVKNLSQNETFVHKVGGHGWYVGLVYRVSGLNVDIFFAQSLCT